MSRAELQLPVVVAYLDPAPVVHESVLDRIPTQRPRPVDAATPPTDACSVAFEDPNERLVRLQRELFEALVELYPEDEVID